jgi:hypothetical protein
MKYFTSTSLCRCDPWYQKEGRFTKFIVSLSTGLLIISDRSVQLQAHYKCSILGGHCMNIAVGLCKGKMERGSSINGTHLHEFH